MRDPPTPYSETEQNEHLQTQPGVRYDLDRQCRDASGDQSAVQAGPLSDVCQTLTCRLASNSGSSYTIYPTGAEEHSNCGNFAVRVYPECGSRKPAPDPKARFHGRSTSAIIH